MEHKIDPQAVGIPQASAMTHAISTCVHCGFCLPACPTYQVLQEEMDSPRGRIVLMRGVLENQIPLDQATAHLDRCLGCLGCVTACPSGVPYGELITSFRDYSEDKRSRPLIDRLTRTLANETLPHARRFRWAVAMSGLARPLASVLPKPLRAMLGLAPKRLARHVPIPRLTAARGTKRGRVALLVGCVQQELEPDINMATIRVLSENGFEVVVPARQSCCGALGMHTGMGESARRLAAKNFGLFQDSYDAIITNAAGCGSGIKEYELLFRDHRLQDEAIKFSKQVRDISEFLDGVGLVPPRGFERERKLAYHDACHLAHAQGIVSEPRRLLGQIPGVKILEIPNGDQCCGSAGTYNIEQPEIADRLGQLKAESIHSLAADAVVLGNIGCMVQIRNHLARLRSIPVYHTVQILDQAYGNDPS
jgi:glycolate oxidase iron-sulfur subunit